MNQLLVPVNGQGRAHCGSAVATGPYKTDPKWLSTLAAHLVSLCFCRCHGSRLLEGMHISGVLSLVYIIHVLIPHGAENGRVVGSKGHSFNEKCFRNRLRSEHSVSLLLTCESGKVVQCIMCSKKTHLVHSVTSHLSLGLPIGSCIVLNKDESSLMCLLSVQQGAGRYGLLCLTLLHDLQTKFSSSAHCQHTLTISECFCGKKSGFKMDTRLF